MKARVEIPVEWCSDKDIVFGYLSFEAARAISESDLPENYQIDLFANRGSLPTGKTSAPAAAVPCG